VIPGNTRPGAAYGAIMAADPELAAAIAGRAHWRLDGDAAVYQPPGAEALVRIQPVRSPARRERYHAAIIRSATAVYSTPVHTAVDGVRWAERSRLT
jgi:hypothetical protein